jgi:hypothetical protein
VRWTADPAELKDGADEIRDLASVGPLLTTTVSFALANGLAPHAFFWPVSILRSFIKRCFQALDQPFGLSAMANAA